MSYDSNRFKIRLKINKLLLFFTKIQSFGNILKRLSKNLYFREKTVIISLFLVRFQIRLIHMTVLFILHVTKEKNIKKVL